MSNNFKKDREDKKIVYNKLCYNCNRRVIKACNGCLDNLYCKKAQDELDKLYSKRIEEVIVNGTF